MNYGYGPVLSSTSPVDDKAPIVRIAESLERIALMLEKMANPPVMVRYGEQTFEFNAGDIKAI